MLRIECTGESLMVDIEYTRPPMPPLAAGAMNLIKNGLPRHPGDLLKEKMARIAISSYRLAPLIGVQRSRLQRIERETHPMSADTALRLAKFFGNSAEEWLDLQTRYDLAAARKNMEQDLLRIQSIKSP
jgi:addiction module HigA family antidote